MSRTLYIIGNGFDLANGINTSYNCFREYLLGKVNLPEEEKDFFPIQRNGVLAPDNSKNAELIAKMIDSALSRVYHCKQDWRYFEDVLGRLKYEDLWNDKGENELNGILVHIVFTRLRDYFNEWISGIDLGVAKQIKDFQHDENSLFLSFNYTMTLENIYRIPHGNICHVHGSYGDSELVFGHKEDEDSKYIRESAAERQVAIVREMLIKNTRACYRKNQDFFTRINRGVDRIISIGFSYGDVDLYYIEKIIANISDDAIWYLHQYKLMDTLHYACKIRKCGFRGKIRMFKDFKEIF